MRKLLPLAALLAVPAQAQDGQDFYASDSWPVHASAGTCTLVPVSYTHLRAHRDA